jgi:hypothetical protein
MVLSRDIVPAFSKTFPILYNLVDFYGLNTYAKSFVCGDKMHQSLEYLTPEQVYLTKIIS